MMASRAPLRVSCLAVSLFALSACAPVPAPAPETLINTARKLDLEGRHDDAIAAFRQALDRAPDSYDAHYGIARALDLAGAYDEARQHFARAIALAPEESKDQTLRMMGIAWAFAGNRAEAARYFEQVVERRASARNHAGAAEVANELGRVQLELGDLTLAEAWYRRGHEEAGKEADRPVSQIDLADMRWAHAQARIAARRGRAAEAHRYEAEVKRLLDKGGNDDQRVQLAYLTGYVEYYLEHDRAAIAALEQADQADPFVLVLLAQAHERLEERDLAREYYTKVLTSTSHAVNNAFARPLARQKLAATR